MMYLLERLKLKTETRKLKIPSGGEDVEQQELSHVADGKAKWYSHSGKQLDKLNTHFPNDSAVPPLGIYPREIRTYVHTQTHR